MEFRKVTMRNFVPSLLGGFDVHEAIDYVASDDLPLYVSRAAQVWAVVEDSEDDRPADADRTYTPPAPEGI